MPPPPPSSLSPRCNFLDTDARGGVSFLLLSVTYSNRGFTPLSAGWTATFRKHRILHMKYHQLWTDILSSAILQHGG